MTIAEFFDDLSRVLDGIGKMLLEKNKSYGDSALNPKRIFSKADLVEQIKVRIDDKLSRIQNGSSFENDNDLDDLLGYLVLLKIAMSRQKKANRVKKVVESVADMVGKAQDELRCHGWRDLQNNDIWDSADPMQMTVVHYSTDDKKHEEDPPLASKLSWDMDRWLAQESERLWIENLANKKHDEEFRRQEIKQKIMDERDYDSPELHVPD